MLWDSVNILFLIKFSIYVCMHACVLAWTSRTKYYRLNNENLFLAVLEAGRSKIRVPAESVPGGGPSSGLWTAAFLPCPQMAEEEWGQGWGERRKQALWCLKDTDPIRRPPPSWPHLSLIITQRPHFHHNCGLGLQHKDFAGAQFSL